MKKYLKQLAISCAAISMSLATLNPVYAGEWKQSQTGWWYQEGTTYPTNQWKQIDGSWYHFNQDGIMQTGWLQLENKWYYLEDSGVMVTGTKTIDGTNYTFASDGSMQATNDWKDISGYYIADNGFTNPDYAVDELSHGVSIEKYKGNTYIITEWADTEKRFHYSSSFAFDYEEGKTHYIGSCCASPRLYPDGLHLYVGNLGFMYDGSDTITISYDNTCYDMTVWNGTYTRDPEYDFLYD